MRQVMKHVQKTLYIFTALLIVSVLGGCSKTSVTGVWKKSDYAEQPLNSILVVALTGDQHNKTLWENIMADKLNQNGLSALTAVSSFPGDPKITEDEIMKYVKQQGIDGVLVTRLVDTKKEEVYYPPSGGYYGGNYGYYNRFGSYYPHAYDTVYTTPGRTTTHTTVLLETNLYLASTQELIWSMSSDTFDPRSINQLVESVSKKVVQTLQKDNLIRKPASK